MSFGVQSKVSHNLSMVNTVLFSYDKVGYSTRLEMTIYLSKEDWQNHNSVMRVSLTQKNILDNYNIVEHLDKFQLKLQ